ncbi:MAG TPA: hypothetical protein VHL77_10195 [Ferruginibacter sp.]|jgi:uncharacterized membrane protein YgcG|nr:hypothetical protein [Ferruginibacter sp.]
MQSKILLFVLSIIVFSSCSTAYKTGQTPDDVYYSPARVIVKEDRNDKDEQVKKYRKDDYEITMSIRDRRWRDFRDDYEYNNSPYNYTFCNCNCNYGYYYNPYYYPWAIYTTKLYTAPVNTTPRMVNLNAYNGYNTRVAAGKTNGTISWSNPATQYNNSNRSANRSETRQVLYPRYDNSSSNETRTYSPSSSRSSSSSSSSSSSGSSSGSSSSGSVSRPNRGG